MLKMKQTETMEVITISDSEEEEENNQVRDEMRFHQPQPYFFSNSIQCPVLIKLEWNKTVFYKLIYEVYSFLLFLCAELRQTKQTFFVSRS